MSSTQFCNMFKYIADNHHQQANFLGFDETLRINFQSAPGFIGPVGYVYTKSTNAFRQAKRFAVVFKRIRYATATLGAGALIIVTAYPY